MTVTSELVGPVALITIDDGKANAYSGALLDELAGTLAEVRDEALAVVIAGRPGVFSAGYDLATMRSSEEAMRALLAQGGRVLMDLFLYPLPVVLACTGHAMAAGAVTLLAGDRRIGAEGDFKIAMNEVPLGLPVPAYGVELARYKVPPSLLDFVALGATFEPQGALRAGFFDQVVAPDQVVPEALAQATAMAELATVAVAGTKQRLRGDIAAAILTGLDADLATFRSPWTDA
jgi:enoyl-CoA hydratase